MKLYVATHLKDMNRKVVYRLMEAEEVLSKTDISRRTGISAPTVMKITSYMVEKGILLECGEGNAALGRRPMLLRFNPNAAYTIGVGYEGTHAVIGIVDLKGKVKHIVKEKTNSNFKDYFNNNLAGSINDLIEESAIDRTKILGAGIGIPGAIDSENNIIHFAPLIGLNEKEDLSTIIDKLSTDIGMPLFIENDVNAAAVGEYVARNTKGNSNMIYITAGTGVGAGIIIDGKLHKGIRFSAGEVGYMVFEREFTTSKTRGGWLEGQVSHDLLLREWGISDSKDISSLNPALIDKAIDHAASYIGLCIANMTSVLDMKLFVVGGVLAEAFGDRFFEILNHYVDRLCLNETRVEHQNCLQPTVVGVASIAMENMLDSLLTE